MDYNTIFYCLGTPLSATLCIPERGNEALLSKPMYTVPKEAAINFTKYPTVLLCHGNARHKNDGLEALALKLAENGITSLRFDFFGNANSGTRYHQLPHIELPYNITCALNYLEGLPFVDSERIGMAGISMGGALCMYMIGHDEKRIKSAVTMAAPADCKVNRERRWGDKAGEYYRQIHEDMLINAATGCSRYFNRMTFDAESQSECDMGILESVLLPDNSAYTTMESVWSMLQLRPILTAQNIRCPIMITHGLEDQTVPYSDAQKYYDAIPDSVDKKICLYEGVDHNIPICAKRDIIFNDIVNRFLSTL